MIFTTDAKVFKYGIFDKNLPIRYESRLRILLKKCSLPSVTPWPRTSPELMRELRTVLRDSIKSEKDHL